MKTYLDAIESPLQKEMNKLVSDLKEILSSEKKIKPHFDILLPSIFNFRIKAMKWLWEEEGLNIESIMDNVYPQLEELKENPKLENLTENIFFALRCNQRVIKSVINSSDFSENNLHTSISKLPAITYEQFLASLAFSIPDDNSAQKFLDWVNSSLYIEGIILSAVIINDERLQTSDNSINELAFLIADSAQEYSALATEFGFLKLVSQEKTFFKGDVNKEFIEDQKEISDLDIDDFAKLF